jgi:tetraacyldisaccharide 4'-kinase
MLRLAEIPYGWAVRYRNSRYDRRVASIHAVDVPVVCVGNLTLGGTGKTPLVEWLARWFCTRGVRVAIVSRGYGARDGIPNDEALELAHALPGVPHVQNADRVVAARETVDQYAAELIVLDDGFQHRRLRRDLDVVLLDASEPFGMEHLFPRGTLREPPESLRRADVVVLSRATLLDEPGRETIRRRVARLAPQSVWCEVDHQPTALANQAGQRLPLEHLAGRPVVAFCGIGNPAGFRHTLTALGCRPTSWREFADHHAYTREEIETLKSWAAATGAELAICTRKDLVKLQTVRLGATPLWAVEIELQFLRGQSELESLLAAKLKLG